MKLYIKQKLFKLTDTYDIYDEHGNQKYYAKCDFTLLLHRLRVYDNVKQFGHVEQHFSFMPTFSFYLDEQYLGEIQKKFTLFYPAYTMNFNGWTIDGDFFDMDYEVKDEYGNLVMHFHKEWFTITDQYCLEIIDPQHEKLCVLIALAVDMAICSQKND